MYMCICPYILVMDHLHQTQLSESSLGIGLILEWLHQFLDGHLLPCLVVQCRAEGERERGGKVREGGGGGGGEKEVRRDTLYMYM